MTNVTKLTSTHNLMWSRQVHVLFDAYDLTGYIDDSLEVPSATDIVPAVNQEYSH